MPNQAEMLTVPLALRNDATIRTTRSGELYGCELNVYVKATVAGKVIRIKDSAGETLKEFIEPTETRIVPASVLQAAPHVALDVMVTVKQPSALTGRIQVDATLQIPGQPASVVGDTLVLKAGDEAGILDVGWGIDA